MLFSLAFHINVIGLTIVFCYFIKFICGQEQTGVDHRHVCSMLHGCFHSDTEVTPSDPETSSKGKDEEKACSAGLRGQICTANHSDFYIPVC